MMQFKYSVCLAIPSLALLTAAPLLAAENEAPPAQAEQTTTAEVAQTGPTIMGVVTPKLYYFDYTDGPASGENNNHYFQQYSPLETLGGDSQSGFFPDVDLDLTLTDSEHIFTLQREGFGKLNQSTSGRFEHEMIGAKAYYSTFTTGSNGADVLNSPLKQPNQIERTNLGASFTVKPPLLGDLFTATFAFDRYQREGGQYETFKSGDIGNNPSYASTNILIDESVNKLSLNLSASPGGGYNFAYEASVEHFNNLSGSGGPTPAGYIVTSSSTQDLFYIPDSTQFTHGISVSKQFGSQIAFAAGFSTTKLEQESFLVNTQATDPGEITTDNAYVTLQANATDRLDLEGHIKQSKRDNDTRYTGQTPYLVNKLDSLEYGLAATYRLSLWNSTLSFGLDHRNLDRDLTVAEGIFFRDQTHTNEAFVKWNARPLNGVTVQLTPSYTWASETALPTEPENAYGLKALVSYASPTGLLVSGFYNFKHQKNNKLSITETFQTNTDSISQNIDDTFHTAGVTLGLAPTENINTSASLFWTQTDAETYYTEFRRTGSGDINMVTLFDLLNYKVRTVGVVLNADWQATDNLLLRGAYSYTQSEGDTAAPSTPQALAVPAFIDSTIQAISVGGEYKLNKTTSLNGYYQFEHYDDKAYTVLKGGLHTFMLGLSFKF